MSYGSVNLALEIGSMKQMHTSNRCAISEVDECAEAQSDSC